MARTKEQRKEQMREYSRQWREEIKRADSCAYSTGTGVLCFCRDSGTTIGDLEELLGRTMYPWEYDLWQIAYWCGSRRFLNIER